MLGLLSNKLALGLGIAAVLAAVSTWAATNAYLKKRDELVQQEMQTNIQKSRADHYYANLLEQQKLREELDEIRVGLTNKVTELESRKVETITEIREVWRDREVIVENPVAVDCSYEPMPDAIVGLLCHASGIYSLACANLHPDSI